MPSTRTTQSSMPASTSKNLTLTEERDALVEAAKKEALKEKARDSSEAAAASESTLPKKRAAASKTKAATQSSKKYKNEREEWAATAEASSSKTVATTRRSSQSSKAPPPKKKRNAAAAAAFLSVSDSKKKESIRGAGVTKSKKRVPAGSKRDKAQSKKSDGPPPAKKRTGSTAFKAPPMKKAAPAASKPKKASGHYFTTNAMDRDDDIPMESAAALANSPDVDEGSARMVPGDDAASSADSPDVAEESARMARGDDANADDALVEAATTGDIANTEERNDDNAPTDKEARSTAALPNQERKNERKYASRNRHAEMLQDSTKSKLCKVLPFNQAFELKQVNPMMFVMLHKALAYHQKRNLKTMNWQKLCMHNAHAQVPQQELPQANSLHTMLHWDLEDGDFDSSRTVEDAHSSKISVDQTQFFDNSINDVLKSFAMFVTVLLKKEIAKDEASFGMTHYFGLQKTVCAMHGELHCSNTEVSTAAHDLWLSDKLETDSWKLGYTLFLPLCLEGMVVRIRHHSSGDTIGQCNPTDYESMTEGTYEVKFGSCLLLRNDVMRSGHYGAVGNTSLFCEFYPSSGSAFTKNEKKYISANGSDKDPLQGKRAATVLRVSTPLPDARRKNCFATEFLSKLTCHDSEYHRNVLPHFRGGGKHVPRKRKGKQDS